MDPNKKERFRFDLSHFRLQFYINYGRGRNGNKIMINIYRERKLKWKAGCGMYLKP